MEFEKDELLDDQIENDDVVDGEVDLINAIKSLKESEDNDTDTDDEEVDEMEDNQVEESDDDDNELEVEDEEVEDEPKKKVQSKEDNAKFAAQRRQRELEEKLQQSPEYQLAKRLSDMYGKPVDQIMRELEDAELQKESEATKIPVEYLRKQRENEVSNSRLQEELNQLKFENWQSRIKLDGESLKKDYPMLSQEDMDSAVEYILYEAKNVNMPLEQAVYALHGKKIIEAQVNNKIQDDLATKSGRAKKTPLSPNNSKGNQAATNLTSEEKYMAKQFGMTEAEYAKYKN